MNPDEQALLGQVVGGYVIESVLGFGGMSVVYFARKDDASRAPAAVKVLFLSPSMAEADRREFSSRFKREVQALLDLEHPRIPAIMGFGIEDRYFYLVMQFIDGRSLAVRLEGGHLPFPEIARYLEQIASALDYAHGKGIIHRDIKPANILRDRSGNAYLSDFGIARSIERISGSPTVVGQVIGTPDYMSPEQIRGERVGPASDIFSLGLVLYEMVTGRLPFERVSPQGGLDYRKIDELPLAPRQLRQDLPPGSEIAILRALSVNPLNRFATAQELFLDFIDGFQQPGISVISTIRMPNPAPDAMAIAGSEAPTDPTTFAKSPRAASFQPNKMGSRILLAAFLAIVLLVTGIAVKVFVPHAIDIFLPATAQATGTPIGAAGKTATSASKGGPHPGSTASPSATLPSTGTPPAGTPGSTATSVPGATQTPTATTGPPTQTPTPVPPTLAINPTSATLPLCTSIVASTTFTVENTGGGVLDWTANWSGTGYSVSPSSGPLGAGASIAVKVSKITKSGTVTINAPGVNGSPQIFSITCTT